MKDNVPPFEEEIPIVEDKEMESEENEQPEGDMEENPEEDLEEFMPDIVDISFNQE